jgi:hypothetical protein
MIFLQVQLSILSKIIVADGILFGILTNAGFMFGDLNG